MARAFPPQRQAPQRAADTGPGDREGLCFLQVLDQQGCRLHRGAVAEVAWVTRDHRGNQRLNPPLEGARAATACPGGNAGGDV